MSVDQLTSPRASRPSGEPKLVQYDQYIDTQIKNTRRAVKLVDVATALVMLATSLLAFLLTAAIVEHWLVPGGFSVAVRTVLFVILVGGAGYFAYRRLWPLMRRAINPVYAAHTIERSSPTLKNSLINLLLFRQHRSEISDVVYRTLEEQAAQRLTRVPVEAAVDRSLLIRVGYVLLAVVALAALYKVFSPKDPLVAAERVLMPWRDIVPASRVTIGDVKPGALTVSRGEFLTVSAEVRGIDDDDPVLLRYTSNDGQAIDKPLEMKLSSDGLRFEGRLPDDARANDKIGLTQSFKYRIEAGDARSLDYAVTVVPAPSILVERVEYDYPTYTGFVDRQVEGLGDIRAIEGTRVTIHARANGPIKEAQVDFDADGRRDLTMTAIRANASASFVLELREDRQTARHASYVLRFTNAQDRSNREPVKHPIVVDPDLQPEATILVPQEKSLDVRLNDSVAIEVEARDPDFALAEVRLLGEVAGRGVIDEPLLVREHAGRFTARYQFTPSKHNLKAGDVVQYWVAASDNRAPKANSTESERKLLRIVSADPKQPPQDRIAQRDQQRPPGGAQQGEQQQQEGGQQGEANEEGQAGDQQQGGETQPNSGDGQRQGDNEKGTQGEGESASTNGNPADTTENAQAENDPARPNQEGDAQQEPGNNQGEQDSNDKQNGKQSGEQTGAGTADGDSSQQGSQSVGTRPDGNRNTRPAEGDAPNGAANAEPGPVSSEGDNDAEAFKRIQKHLNRNGELRQDESPPDSKELSRDAQRSAEEEQRQGDKETERQGDETKEPGDEAAARDGESASADGKNQVDPREGDPQDQTGQRREDRGEGTGAETRQDDLPEDPQQQENNGDNHKESPGGQQTSTKGPSGAGEEQNPKGAPNSQPEMKPSEKRQQSGSDGNDTNEEEPAAGARGKRESDSQGEEGGDKAGGGEEGGGQKAPREGTGSAGQNQSADEGAGESSEKGAGNNSPNAGEDAVAKNRTGQSGGETTERGSKRRDGEGEEPGGEADTDRNAEQSNGDKEPFSREAKPSEPDAQRQGEKETGGQGEDTKKPGDESAKRDSESKSAEGNNQDQRDGEPNNQSGERNSESGDQEGGAPNGSGGHTGTAGRPAQSTQGDVPDGDAANLEYARKQTDLVLDKLAEKLNRKGADEKLLKELGWTEDDLRKFLERWQQRKNAARRDDQAGESARRELDEALRSLGLRPGALQQSRVKDDKQRDLSDGYRGAVPPKYQEQLRRYNRGVSRARPEGE
jgi:hypothetical protein